MKIDRSELLKSMIAFFESESGVVVGDPGVGKSYLLTEMIDALLHNKIPATMVRMDFLTEGTDAEIAESLVLSDINWIAALTRIDLPEGKHGLMVFDSYDSIRDEKLKTTILKQIAKAKRELTSWSIVVSVRTYDAARSQKLIDLFPAEFNENNIHCRRFVLPILTSEELNTFLSHNKKLDFIYQEGTNKLKKILKIPFFISLLNIILTKTDASAESLRVLKSEIELLEMYWVKVVYGVTPSLQTEIFLKNFTIKLVSDRVLSTDKLDYLDELSAERILIAERLLSANVLAEQGSFTAKIGYGHNILFDYAVSKLVLKDTEEDLLNFITVDPARPFFLRPSFIYFFARLWHSNRVKFWIIYNKISHSSDKVISLFNKLIPSTVIAREFDEIKDLELLYKDYSNNQIQVINVLQALRFLKEKNNKAAQASFILELSYILEFIFVFDFTIILKELIDTPEIKTDYATFDMCGLAARNLMDFLMANNNSVQINRLAAYHGTELIIKTYSTNVEATRKRLQIIVEMLYQPGFNITYFSTLTENVATIHQVDPEFCIIVYQKVFAHEENSDDRETMHTSVLMSFTFNRKDQFETCYSILKQFFPTFLRDNPEKAICVGLNIANQFIKRQNQEGIFIPESITTPFEFAIDGTSAHYQVDMSHYWSEYGVREDHIDLSRLVINYLEALITASEVDILKANLKCYFEHAYYAHNWKVLLDFGAKHAEMLHDLLFELLLQPAILFWSDTVVVAAAFLEAAAPFFNNEQIHSIEKTILSLPDYIGEQEKNDCNAVVLRLISRIPKDRLKEGKAIALIATIGPVPNEAPFYFETSIEKLTTKKFLDQNGIDVDSPENETLLAENETMENFSEQFLNNVPTREMYEEPLKLAMAMFKVVKINELPDRLSQTLLTSIASVCGVVLRSELRMQNPDSFSRDWYEPIKEIIKFCLAEHTESDTFAEEHSSPASGYSSTPRIGAASALPRLFRLTNDAELLPLIIEYANDKNPVTRYCIIQSLYLLYVDQNEIFWKIIYERLPKESDWFTKAELFRKLDNRKIFSDEKDNFLAACQLVVSDISTISDANNSFLDAFLLVSLAFLRMTGDLRINNILDECLDQNLSIATHMVFHGFKILEPENFYRDYTDATDVQMSQRLVDVLLALLGRCEKIMISVRPNDPITKEVEQAFKIIDSVILRIYISMQVNREIVGQNRIKITSEKQQLFYYFIKPLLLKTITISRKLGDGHMQGHSAHYFIEIMGQALRFDAHFSLATTSEITAMTLATQYTSDSTAVREVVQYTERLLADHKSMLTEPEAFGQIMDLLNIYVQAGWPEALDLLWRLDDIFR